ncbi:putative 30S ribosomal protein S24e [groundwater metagenome]|uniref:Putative 30S ribosomal protein S24e n=1 Tax=groundwater metagenome TaxID=717931 RepID=A0A098E808_9ZZZZ
MDTEILNEKDNRLLERKELNLKISYEGKKPTPKLNEIKGAITAKLNLDKALIVIDNINQPFGVHYSDVYAKIYDNENAMKVETRPVLKKNLSDEKVNAILGVKKKKEVKGKKKGAAAPAKK